jgi:integrase/recombinase XerD
MEPRFEQFIRERNLLHNVSPRTLEWYRQSLCYLPCTEPTQQQLNDVICLMRERGLKPSGCNCKIRAINAYLHWASGSEGKCGAGCNHPQMRRLKEPKLVMPTYTDAQVKKLIAWKPKDRYERRLHLLVLFLLDTGCRIGEAVGLRVADLDFDNLLVTLDGKGSKQRVVPFSFELRKVLYRYVAEYKPNNLLLACETGTQMSRCNALRDVKALCKRLGFTAPARTLHSFRHTFAVNYLRQNCSVFHLQKALGHETLEMSRRYCNLATADLQAVHQRVSLLSK